MGTIKAASDMVKVFLEIEKEIIRADAKHGNNIELPSLDASLIDRSPGRMLLEYGLPSADAAKQHTDLMQKRGTLTHAHIVVEELCESIDCMKDEAAMRIELIQLAAVTVKWIRSIDNKHTANPNT